MARLQAKHDAAVNAERKQHEANKALSCELRQTQERLQASQQEATRYRTEAQTVQALLDPGSRPTVRYDRKPANFLASFMVASILIWLNVDSA